MSLVASAPLRPTTHTPTTHEALELAATLAGRLCDRKGIDGIDAEEFQSFVAMRLLRDDCAVLRRFRGESGLRTFMTTVVTNLLHDYRDHLWGRWRPSAAARRHGELGVALDQCLNRDRMPLRESVSWLRARGFDGLDVLEAARVAARIPDRPRRIVEGGEALVNVACEGRPDRAVLEAERRRLIRRAVRLVRRAIDALPREDRMIATLKLDEGLTVADISRRLDLDQKPLYRRVDRIMDTLREAVGGLSVEELFE